MKAHLRADKTIAFGALLLLAALSPAFLTDFGVHNDWRIGEHGMVADLTFGHIESYHLVRVGRILNAYLYNAQYKQIDSYTDLKLWRFVSASLLVASFIAVALQLRRSTLLSARRAVALALALFLAPPLTVDVYYASLLVPGTVGIALASGTYIIQRRLLVAALASASPVRRLAIWSILTVAALIVGHFIYTPSTAFFLVLAAIHLLHGPVSSRSRSSALLELGAYVLSCLLYFVVQREIVFPWASTAFAYGSRWTDPQYTFDVSLVPGERGLEFLRDAAYVSFNAWNAFTDFNAAWIVAPVIAAALVRHAFSGVDRERRRHGLAVLAFFVACFGLSIAPAVVSNFRWADYRILVGPVLLVCVAFLWAVFSLRERLWPVVSSGLLACATLATLVTAVHEARAEVECLQRFLLRGPRVDSLLLLAGERGGGGSRLRQEFGYRIQEVGPLDEFGFQVIDDLRRHGRLAPARAALLEGIHEVNPEEAEQLKSAPRTAVLSVGARSCSCVAGLPCRGLRASSL